MDAMTTRCMTRHCPLVPLQVSQQFLESFLISTLLCLGSRIATPFFTLSNCYLVVPLPVLGHFQVDSLANAVLIIVFCFQTKGHREPPNKVGLYTWFNGIWTGILSILLKTVINPSGYPLLPECVLIKKAKYIQSDKLKFKYLQ